jgi:hypothetical protein
MPFHQPVTLAFATVTVDQLEVIIQASEFLIMRVSFVA